LDQEDTPRARIAWHAPHPDPFRDAARAFETAGYRLIEGAAPGVDVNVFDLRSGEIPARAAQQTALDLRRSAPESGAVYVVPFLMSAAERAHLRRLGEVAISEGDLSGVIHACRQRLRLRNVAEEAGERLKSIAALTRLSDFPPIETSNRPPSVLIAGAPGPMTLAAIARAEEMSERADAALSASQAMRALETRVYDCAVFLPRGIGDPLLGLARTMRRHRRFQDLPILVLPVEAQDGARGEMPSNVEIMLAGHLDDDLASRLVTLTRRARLLGAMRSFLSYVAGDGVRDRISGAFTPAFFGQHAERLFTRADQTGRMVSLIGVRLAAVEKDDMDVGGVRTLTEAARLINRVSRAEDCVGRIAHDVFVVLQSATRRIDAEKSAARIEGVIANTMFRSRAGKRVFAVAATTNTVERRAGEHLEEALARMLVDLKKAEPRTAER
jgi:PleD family two-component response regulator